MGRDAVVDAAAVRGVRQSRRRPQRRPAMKVQNKILLLALPPAPWPRAYLYGNRPGAPF